MNKIPKVNNYDQFSFVVMLILLVKKGIITEQEMNEFYDEVVEIDKGNKGEKNFDKTIEQLLSK